jgi:hypothetical protein
MIEKKYADLINKIIQKTEQGKLQWDKTNRGTEYFMNFSDGKITTDMWVDEDGNKRTDFIIFNNNGDSIWSVSVTKGGSPEEYQFIASLHQNIRKKYYKIEETIDSLIKDLDSKL